MNYPKVLIISHNCFSDSGSNGRTLANFFEGYPPEKLAQFYIYSEKPSAAICDNYYRVTDVDAVRSLLSSKCGGVIRKEQGQSLGSATNAAQRIPRKTPFVYCIREFVWKAGRWNNKRLQQWMDDFSPEVVLFQSGDAAFLFDFSRRVAQRRNIPLVIYNSESYYFKEHNYLAASALSDCWYRVLHRYFRKHAAKAIRYAARSIYISDALREIYDAEFHAPSISIMTSSALLEGEKTDKAEHTRITYLGNLGVGRNEPLIELAKLLQSIDPELKLSVYGKAAPEIVRQFEAVPGIDYCGFVSYDECVKIMRESTLLIHVENFSDFYLEDSKYAFSTKIADSLACGTCLFLYAPKQLSCAEYLASRGAACVASSPDEARAKLAILLRSEDVRKQFEHQAVQTAEKNHSVERNRQRFLEVMQHPWGEGQNESFAD